jgi:hypothetical protein
MTCWRSSPLVFYTDELSTLSQLAFLGVVAPVVLNTLNVRKATMFVLVGVYTWVCVLKSGVHATLAEVVVGLAMPLRGQIRQSLLERTEHELRPWVAYGIIPLFAFVNAGVPLSGIPTASLLAAVPLGGSSSANRLGSSSRPRPRSSWDGLSYVNDRGPTLWWVDLDRYRFHHEPVCRGSRLLRREDSGTNPARGYWPPRR